MTEERDRLFAWIAENARRWFDGRSCVTEGDLGRFVSGIYHENKLQTLCRYADIHRRHVDLIRGGGSPSSDGSVVDDAAFDMIEELARPALATIGISVAPVGPSGTASAPE